MPENHWRKKFGFLIYSLLVSLCLAAPAQFHSEVGLAHTHTGRFSPAILNTVIDIEV